MEPIGINLAFQVNNRGNHFLLINCRRKKIGVLATARLKGHVPKFNSPQIKTDLATFASEIASQCAMPEVGFNEHVQASVNNEGIGMTSLA